MKKYTVLFLFLFSWIIYTHTASAEMLNEWEKQTTDNSYKVWTVKFNKLLNKESIHNNNIYVMDVKKNKKIQTNIIMGKDGYSIMVEAPPNGYSEGEYTMFIQGVMSRSNETVKSTKFPFSVVPLSIVLTNVSQNILIPQTLDTLHNDAVKTMSIEWNYEEIKEINESTYQVKGTIQNTSKVITLQVVLDSLYFTTFTNNLLAPVVPIGDSEEGYRDAKLLEFLYKELIQNSKNLVQPDLLVASHLKGTIHSTLFKSMANEYLDSTVFDTAIKEEKEISSCLSDLIVARAFLLPVDAGVSSEKCIEMIFDYIDASYKLDAEDISVETIDALQLEYNIKTFNDFSVALKNEVDGMSGYWLKLYTDFSFNAELYVLEEKEWGQIQGKRYLIHVGDEDIRNVEGLHTADRITLTSVWDKETFMRYMKNIYNTTTAKYLGDNYYSNTTTITNVSSKTGTHSLLTVNRDGSAIKNTSPSKVELIRLKEPSFWQTLNPFYDNFDYLEDMKNRY
ncbi:hypothetical protein [Solibacillus sp. FSL K6-1554]|uniref:hypothetical protein n=1 Tax=Solibacillus sp. FSL K6-1554 TaxID=2921472 RepID=UPI0030FD0B79